MRACATSLTLERRIAKQPITPRINRHGETEIPTTWTILALQVQRCQEAGDELEGLRAGAALADLVMQAGEHAAA